MTDKKLNIDIIAADFNKSIVDTMIESATDTIMACGHNLGNVFRVAGCYEIPLIAATRLDDNSVDIIIVLGFIEQGETLHGEVMGHVVHSALIELQIRKSKPIGLGIIGPGATNEQADARKISSAKYAVQAAVQNYLHLRNPVA